MFKLHYIVGIAALSIAGMIAQADPIDPVMSMDDPPVGTPVGLGFFFSSNANGGGFLQFNNASGVLWTTFDVFVTLQTGSPITCFSGPFFNSCTTTSSSQGGTISQFDIHFSNVTLETLQPQQGTGIAPGDSFSLNLNDLVDQVQPTDPNGIGGWGANNSFNASANGAPEPASWLLLASGGAVLFGIRRYGRRMAA